MDAGARRRRRRSRCGPSTTAPNIGAAVTVPVTVGARTCPCSMWSPTRRPTVAADPDTVRHRARRQVPRRRRRHGHRRSGSTRAPATPARTSGTCGRRPGRCWRRVTFTGETASGWQQATFSHAGRGHRRHDVRGRRTTRRTATTPPTTATSRRRRPTRRRCTRLADGADGPNGVYRLRRRRRLPDPGVRRPRTTGSTSCSPPDPAAGRDTTPPTVTSRTPGRRRDRRGRRRRPSTATFSEPVQAGTIRCR